MSPKRIVERAMEKNLDIIGITDHNSAENVQAAINAAQGTLTVLAGMEITSAEEVHIIALFDNVQHVLALQETVYKHLTPGENKEDAFGKQIIVNEFDEIEGYNKRLLIGATRLTSDFIVRDIHDLGGLAVASHIDRETYSIIGQLGFIPKDLDLDALEISPNTSQSDVKARFPEVRKFALVASSDAHFLHDIGKATTEFQLAEPTMREIRMALQNDDGRKVIQLYNDKH